MCYIYYPHCRRAGLRPCVCNVQVADTSVMGLCDEDFGDRVVGLVHSKKADISCERDPQNDRVKTGAEGRWIAEDLSKETVNRGR